MLDLLAQVRYELLLSTMGQLNLDREEFRWALKDSLPETLREQRGFLEEVFAQVLEDFAMGQAIREGLETDLSSREEVLKALVGRP